MKIELSELIKLNETTIRKKKQKPIKFLNNLSCLMTQGALGEMTTYYVSLSI